MQSRKRDTSWKLSYLVAICLRLTIVLTSTSFIHPDEHFQNTEIAIADVFNRSNRQTRTWEWDPLRISDRTIGGGPVRSIVPVWMTSHLGLHVLKLLHNIGMIDISTRSLVIFPRLVLFFLSLFVDRLIFRLVHSPSIQLLHAFSLHSLLFICRTFSNSLESILFTSLFLLSLSISNLKNRTSISSVIVWTLMNVFTVWVRVSYVCFAFPIVLMVGYTRLSRSFTLFFTAGATGLLGMMFLILLDCLYFGRWPTVTPIGLLLYNLDKQNLAQHGTHPRYLHLLANGPIIFGPALWLTGWSQLWTRHKVSPTIVKLSTASLISGTLLLSIQPHQEARFLLPLVFPLTTLCSQSISKSRSSKFRRTFWFAHLMHSAITVVLFGYLHQGGLQSALEVLPPNTETLLSYKTFDIPSSLITSTQLRNVTNLRGATEETLAKTLCEIVSMDEERRIVLLAPRWALSPSLEHRFKLLFSSAIPHLDLDRLDEIFHAGRHRSGIGLYSIHQQNMKASELCH
ncbi:alpha 1,2 mannosyltransferase [Puccinia graminis f. sp. tritici]|uniref:Mannosyltransferase n=1 Tax=Puccinia graminis f. sp. tritici TaxID=56615 RepID=A0A5B0Q4B0_PUCGR|nr:alpha 1,2 mannosyltransferase [Puccinia graminis f. sp. tritici]